MAATAAYRPARVLLEPIAHPVCNACPAAAHFRLRTDRVASRPHGEEPTKSALEPWLRAPGHPSRHSAFGLIPQDEVLARVAAKRDRGQSASATWRRPITCAICLTFCFCSYESRVIKGAAAQ